MNQTKPHFSDAGYHVLRISLAILMLFHGVAKLSKGTAGIEGMLTSAGLPSILAYGVYLGEVLAPVLLLAGIWVIPAGVLILVNMLFALFLAHSDHLFSLGRSGGLAIELQLFFVVSAITVILLARERKARLQAAAWR